MDFSEIQQDVLDIRFSEGDRDRVKNWINSRYGEIWGVDDWHFKKVAPTSFAITASDDTPTMPSDFSRVTQIFDDQGVELIYRTPWEFEQISRAGVYAARRGRPQGYTVINRQIVLYPIPDANYTFTLSYERLMGVLAGGTTYTVGVLTNNTDEPIFDVAHHYLLVSGAMALGMKLINDPNWQSIEQEFAQKLQAMRDDLLPPDRGENVQYGRDSLGDDFYC